MTHAEQQARVHRTERAKRPGVVPVQRVKAWVKAEASALHYVGGLLLGERGDVWLAWGMGSSKISRARTSRVAGASKVGETPSGSVNSAA